MTTTAKTTKQQEQWVLVHDSYILNIDRASLVRIPNEAAPHSVLARDAADDPSNVLNVSAYPAVAKAAREAQERIGCKCEGEDELCSNCVAADDRLSAALFAVHPEPAPAEGGKT